MQKFLIQGGSKLQGTVKISGSKNAVLPILAACVLVEGETELKNVPDIADVHKLLDILRKLGAEANFEKGTVKINTDKVKNEYISHELVSRMRASILLVGSLIGRFKEVKMAFPGGCVIGKRPIDTHICAFKQLECEVLDDQKDIHLKIKKLEGQKIVLSEFSVTATENIIMGCVLAEGESEIRLAAAEPHVQDLCHFLNTCGAKISGIGTNTLIIKGVKKLKGTTHSIVPDYLEVGTFALAGILTKGDIEITHCNPEDLDSFWCKLRSIGANFELHKNKVHIKPHKGSLGGPINLKTAVYPGFPTDLHAPFAVLMTQTKGVSKVFETLFEGRLNYLFELEKMGAKIEILNPHQAIIIGPKKLRGIPIASCDLRAGAAMVLAALIAEGTTEITNINYIDRGYENLEGKLRNLGADIHRY